jgi:hypothetical protein
MDDEREPESNGWSAIDEALRGVYGDMEPQHWGTIIPYRLGGPDPLTGLSAYINELSGNHWHFVTYGFSELFEKEWDDSSVSGFGFELTFRLAKTSDEDHSAWVFNFLQNLARYVFENGRPFGVAHTMPLNGPIRCDYDTAIQAITFASDPQLSSINTTNGKVDFLQIVGITVDELEAIQTWNAQSFLELIARENPLLVTDIDRKSYLAEEAFSEEVRARASVDGASCGELYSSEFSFSRSTFSRKCKVRLGALVVDGLTARIRGRIPFGRALLLSDGKATIAFVPGEQNRWSLRDEVLEVRLTPEMAATFRKVIAPRAGKYTVPGLDRFEIEVTKTEIRDKDGKVTDIVG